MSENRTSVSSHTSRFLFFDGLSFGSTVSSSAFFSLADCRLGASCFSRFTLFFGGMGFALTLSGFAFGRPRCATASLSSSCSSKTLLRAILASRSSSLRQVSTNAITSRQGLLLGGLGHCA
jgi:hypothetical protein